MIRQFIKRRKEQIGRAIGYIRDVTAYLGPEDDWIEGLRRRLSLKLDPIARPLGRPLVREKGERDYFTTADADSDTVERALMPFYQRNLTSTRKYRIVNGERQWADGSFVYDPADTDWQHHVFIFDNGDGTTDLYGHKEQSAEHDPVGHVSDAQNPGDPDGIARKLLGRSNINFKSLW